MCTSYKYFWCRNERRTHFHSSEELYQFERISFELNLISWAQRENIEIDLIGSSTYQFDAIENMNREFLDYTRDLKVISIE